MNKLVTVKEAAEFLQLTTRTVYKLCSKGKLPVVKLGGAVRIDLSKLNECK